ncbi:MAG TPA: alkaline phosphatase family protein [Blastocatellia bacterium]|nr:alkaline phosphatase family protein [Blastocatellia bacterium]
MANGKRRLLAVVFILILVLSEFAAALGQARRQSGAAAISHGAEAAPASSAKLVVVIVIDQFRYDFLERFNDLFGPGGFRRLMTEGAFLTNANFDYVPTYTAPGHAAVFTGSVPAQNGIVGNAWYDREAGRVRAIVSDSSARVVKSAGPTGDPGAPSPRSLVGTTIGDQMRLATNLRSKVVAVSLKDRAAVLPGGQRPNGAYWFDAASATFVTSDYYTKELPAWVKRFNETERPEKYFGARWDRLAPAAAYTRSQAANLPNQQSLLGRGFPYTITGGEEKIGPKFYAAFELTPFASEFLANFARAAVEAESLGADQFPDLLSISFSTPDLIGHSYGPDSQEVEDTYLRLDGVIADLLSHIDRRVGLQNTVIALTADHGASPVPEYVRSLGMDGGRISGRDLTDAVNEALAARYGGERWVAAFVNDQLHLDRKMMAERKVDPGEAERIAGEAALSLPGIVNYFTRTQILEGRLPQGPLTHRVMNGFNRLRSGDVWLVTKPFAFVTEGNLATTHGSGYSYDTHVPVILFGSGVRKGRYYFPCSPSDIAPTLAALLGIEPPSNQVGHVLPVIEDRPARARR